MRSRFPGRRCSDDASQLPSSGRRVPQRASRTGFRPRNAGRGSCGTSPAMQNGSDTAGPVTIELAVQWARSSLTLQQSGAGRTPTVDRAAVRPVPRTHRPGHRSAAGRAPGTHPDAPLDAPHLHRGGDRRAPAGGTLLAAPRAGCDPPPMSRSSPCWRRPRLRLSEARYLTTNDADLVDGILTIAARPSSASPDSSRSIRPRPGHCVATPTAVTRVLLRPGPSTSSAPSSRPGSPAPRWSRRSAGSSCVSTGPRKGVRPNRASTTFATASSSAGCCARYQEGRRCGSQGPGSRNLPRPRQGRPHLLVLHRRPRVARQHRTAFRTLRPPSVGAPVMTSVERAFPALLQEFFHGRPHRTTGRQRAHHRQLPRHLHVVPRVRPQSAPDALPRR